MKTTALHRFEETTNIGDLTCSPCMYFDYGDVVYHDPRASNPVPLPEADLYICGGGAITTKLIGLRTGKPQVAWGIGQSLKPETARAQWIPLDLEDFEFIGTRDIGVAGTEWVPCVTCMSPLFDEEYEVKYERVSYYNSVKHSHPDMPAEINRYTLAEAISFIASAKIVHTNSYHGAYWATLLGREVVLEDTYSSKFHQFKHQPAEGKTYPDALAECRAVNISFNNKVQKWLNPPS